MAKKGFDVSGRMSVYKFEKLFLDTFGVYCDILTKNNKLAKDDGTLASLKPDDFKSSGKVDFSLNSSMLVGNVIKKFEDNFGVSIQLYDLTKANNKKTLASIRRDVLLDVDDGGVQEKILANEEKVLQEREQIVQVKADSDSGREIEFSALVQEAEKQHENPQPESENNNSKGQESKDELNIRSSDISEDTVNVDGGVEDNDNFMP